MAVSDSQIMLEFCLAVISVDEIKTKQRTDTGWGSGGKK